MIEIILNYKTLKQSLGSLIKMSGYRNSFIAEKIGMAPNNFYVKKQRATWSEEDIEKILKVIENDEIEDYFLGQLMNNLKDDETVTLADFKKSLV